MMIDPPDATATSIPKSFMDVIFAIGGSIIGAVFAIGRKSSALDETRRRIEKTESRVDDLEKERHLDSVALNARIDVLQTSMRDDLKSWRSELRDELKEFRADLRNALRDRDAA